MVRSPVSAASVDRSGACGRCENGRDGGLGEIALSDIDQNKQRSLPFLRAMYDLANDTTSNRVQGPDVANRLGLEVDSEEFHDLARHHLEAGNIQAIETNWSRLAITNEGIAEVESQR
jgi:hypothetical protein